MNTYHADPVEHAARYYDAQGAAAESQSVLHEQMMDSFIDAVREGRNERMPGVQGGTGYTVSEWMFDNSEDYERLMRVLHLALCGDNAQAIHDAAMAAVKPVAERFASAYVLWRAE